MDKKAFNDSAFQIANTMILHGVNDIDIYGNMVCEFVRMEHLAGHITCCVRFLGPYMNEQQILSMYYHKVGLFGVAYYAAAKFGDLLADVHLPDEEEVLNAFSFIANSWDDESMTVPLETPEYIVKVIPKGKCTEEIQELYDAYASDDFVPVVIKR